MFTWEKLVFAAFVIDVFSRKIVGWRVADSMRTELVLDAFEMALWSGNHEDLPVGDGLIMHSDAGSQYTSFSFTRRLIEAGVDPSIGTVGDAYDTRSLLVRNCEVRFDSCIRFRRIPARGRGSVHWR